MKKSFYVPIILFGFSYLLLVWYIGWTLNEIQLYSGSILGALTIIAGAMCLTGTTSNSKASRNRKICLLLLSVSYIIEILLSFCFGIFDILVYIDVFETRGSWGPEQLNWFFCITCLFPIYCLILLVIMVVKDPIIIISSTLEKTSEPSEIKKKDGPHGEPEHDSKLLGTLKTGINKNRTAASTPHSGAEWTCPRCETINHVTDESCKVCGHRRI